MTGVRIVGRVPRMENVLFHKIQRLRGEVEYIKANRERFLGEMKLSADVRKTAERSVFLCAEMVLDIADLMIVKKGRPKPATYRDTIQKLGEYGFVPQEFAYNFMYVAGLRNFLAHDYLEDTTPTLEDFVRRKISDVEKFLALIEEKA